MGHLSTEKTVPDANLNLSSRQPSPPSRRPRPRVKDWYQKVVLEWILRQRSLPPSKDGRHIPLERRDRSKHLMDERRGHGYISNAIRTSRYTVYDFFPKQVFFQFSRVGNFYFLCVGVPQTVPGLSTTGNFTTILPLLFFVLLTIAKEGYDDYRRHRMDMRENATRAKVLRPAADVPDVTKRVVRTSQFPWLATETILGEVDNEHGEGYRWTSTKWENIKVGDVIKLERDQEVPADIVLLHADGENDMAYVETMALDGETNLKSKQVSSVLKGCDTIDGILDCRAEFVVEDPNAELYKFDGRVIANGKAMPLTLNEVVLRGCTLRNTGRAIGFVINTGEECKIRKNANQHPKAKKPALEGVANKIVITLAVYVILLSVGCSVGYLIWQKSTEEYAQYLDGAAVAFQEIIIGFAIQFNNVIPLALYISLEIVKIGQMLMLNSDVDMYDEESDTPARCNTNTILENLGQIGYVFSDKTGTLTENVMKFRKLSIAGTSWLHEADMQIPCPSETESVSKSIVTTVIEKDPVTPKRPRVSIVLPEETRSIVASPTIASPRISMSPSMTRRSSSHWRSTARPDHVQPELTTTDLLEYIRLRPNSLFAKKAKEYILALALCHTCLPELKDGDIGFQASSPDELALVQAARELGYLVVQRSSQTVTLRLTDADGNQSQRVYEILDVIEFSSKRKRMSILLRCPDGRVLLLSKGADSVILPRLKMASMALQKATEVRKSLDAERELLRRSEQQDPRSSLGGRASLTIRRSIGLARSPTRPSKRPSPDRSVSFEAGSKWRASEDMLRPALLNRTRSFDVSKSRSSSPAPTDHMTPEKFTFLDDPSLYDDGTVFAKCFKHLDDFATEGLRTLLFAQKYLSEHEYQAWKKMYQEASTSLVDRQEQIEAAGDLIEQSLSLVGASAIEDKLQKGVPETIDKLRRANVKIWMLTGDKRETAVNIAHSARICKPGSDIFILDASKGSLEAQLLTIADELQMQSSNTDLTNPHTVVVIDGQTLATIDAVEDTTTTPSGISIKKLFYSIIPNIDSVICCRASPAQKSVLVKAIRRAVPSTLTLAIGDGANDLAMIAAAHVGVGISGREGLQAARVADYAVAQFRFLQRLLLVHGRWNYVRTAKFILCTFWKEMFFYLPTALYQRYNGYSGTSLYEMASLTVFNTLFTSLCTICMGIWEQDLSADTLLAVPELYVYGQRNMGLNMAKYVAWMFFAACEGVAVWFAVWASYGLFDFGGDHGLYALGNLAFSIGVMWINWKLFIIETHYKSTVVLACFGVTVAGWWAWQAFLSGIYTPAPSPYDVRGGFSDAYGRDPQWWLTLLCAVLALAALETGFRTLRRSLATLGLRRRGRRGLLGATARRAWAALGHGRGRSGKGEGRGGGVFGDDSLAHGEAVLDEFDLELWQEMEQDPAVRERLRQLAMDEFDDGGDEDEVVGVLSGEVELDRTVSG